MIHPSTNADLAGFAFQFSIAKASLNGSFMESFMTLNIINFADVARREKIRVSWDVGRVSSP